MTQHRLAPEDRLKFGTYIAQVMHHLHEASQLSKYGLSKRLGSPTLLNMVGPSWCPTRDYVNDHNWCETLSKLVPQDIWATAGVGDFLKAYAEKKPFEHLMVFSKEPEAAPEKAAESEETETLTHEKTLPERAHAKPASAHGEPYAHLMVLREDEKVVVEKRSAKTIKAVVPRNTTETRKPVNVSRAIEDLLRISAKAATQNKTKPDFFAQDSACEAPRAECYFLVPFAEAKKTFGQYDFAFVTDCIIRFGHVWSEASLEDREACLCQQRIVCAQRPLLPTKTRWVQAACGLVHNIDSVMGSRFPLVSAYESARSLRLQDEALGSFEVNPLDSMLMIHRGMDLHLPVSCGLDVLKWAENTVLPHDETPEAPLRKHVLARLLDLAPTPARGG